MTQVSDLNLLRALDALLQEGSVTGAAERLQLTAPATSRALGRLREQLGDPLFVRAGRGLVPTPRAMALRGEVRSAVELAERVLRPAPSPDPRALRRKLVVRADDAVTAVLGPPLLARLARDAPAATIVFAAEGDEDVADLREGRVDLDIGVQGALGPEVRTRKLFEDHRVVLTRRTRKAERSIGLRAFAERPQIDVSRRGRTTGPIDALLAEHGLSRHVRAVVSNQLAAAVLVAQTDAVALVSRRFADAMTRTLAVRALRAPAPLESAAIAMAWHPRNDADAGHAWLRAQIAELARGA